MSFEGYYQALCENGHSCVRELWEDDWGNFECEVCHVDKVAWWNLVDVTNGSWDDDGTRIDGYAELEVDRVVDMCVCPTCQAEHVRVGADGISMVSTYKIPKKRGHRIGVT